MRLTSACVFALSVVLLTAGCEAPDDLHVAAVSTLPRDAHVGLERAIAETLDAHRPESHADGPRLGGTRIDALGAHLDRDTFTVGLAAVGREDALSDVPASAPVIDGLEVRIQHGEGVTEWWRSLPSGLEQGVTLAARPDGRGDLVLAMRAGEGARLRALSDDVIRIVSPAGDEATYAHLVVTDADSRRVPARLAVIGERIAIRVDDRGARYPLVVDPLVTVEEAILHVAGAYEDANIGASVAMSADGTRALVCADGNGQAGYVFVRSGTTWTREATLVGSDSAGGVVGIEGFGSTSSLSADGDVAVIGAWGATNPDRSETGRVYVFVRGASGWTEDAILLPALGEGGDTFGSSVAVSPDGSRLVVGAMNDSMDAPNHAGSAFVFARTDTGWVEEAKLVAPDATLSTQLGIAAALSADASVALIGAGRNAYVFTRAGASWSHQATLQPTTSGTGFGWTVSLSAAGDRALVGAQRDDGAATTSGSALVFVYDGSAWALETRLLAGDGATNDHFGAAVSLSADGDRALVGAYRDDDYRGSAYVFVRAGASWSQLSKLTPDPGAVGRFGESAAISSDGTRALVGADLVDLGGPSPSGDYGGAYVFSVLLTNGSACTTGARCQSTFCVDGVCCDTACGGGGDDDCMACIAPLTGEDDGTCAPLTAGVAETVTCRESVDACDPAEVCDPTATECPPDESLCEALDAGTGGDASAGDDAGAGGDASTGWDAGTGEDASAGDDASASWDASAPAPDANMPDAAVMPATDVGCACRAGRGGKAPLAPSLLLGLGLLLVARRTTRGPRRA